ncbi:MAG: hypothetical protein HZB38_08080 [Planctomycetes bacterium]|nr:hypothetical protein [Planctomycetota bacterium]
MPRRSQILCIAAGSLVGSSVLAQPCSPDWNTTVGNPGVSGGYVAPIAAWNDGNGEALFVGGSFTRAGNNATADYVAKWNRSTNTWSPLGTGISPGNTNAFMTCIVPFDPGDGERLVVGGWFARAGSVVESASLAMWNGSAWESLGTGWYYNSGTDSRRGAVWAATAWNNRLYVGGGIFPDGGTIPAGAIASWDGVTWVSEASTLTSISNNPTVFALRVFDDGTGPALYAAGRFDTINGIPATGIARQTETGWAAVGSPFTSMNAFAGLNTMAVFDDGSGPALYAAGTARRPAAARRIHRGSGDSLGRHELDAGRTVGRNRSSAVAGGIR